MITNEVARNANKQEYNEFLKQVYEIEQNEGDLENINSESKRISMLIKQILEFNQLLSWETFSNKEVSFKMYEIRKLMDLFAKTHNLEEYTEYKSIYLDLFTKCSPIQTNNAGNSEKESFELISDQNENRIFEYRHKSIFEFFIA